MQDAAVQQCSTCRPGSIRLACSTKEEAEEAEEEEEPEPISGGSVPFSTQLLSNSLI